MPKDNNFQDIIIPGLVVIYPARMRDIEKNPYLIFGRRIKDNFYFTLNILPYIFEYEGIYDESLIQTHFSDAIIDYTPSKNLRELEEIIQRADSWTSKTRKFIQENGILNLSNKIEGFSFL